MELTREQIEFIAKSATDSYFSNLSEDAKRFVMSDKTGYVRDYTEFYLNALNEVVMAKREIDNAEMRNLEQFGFGYGLDGSPMKR